MLDGLPVWSHYKWQLPLELLALSSSPDAEVSTHLICIAVAGKSLVYASADYSGYIVAAHGLVEVHCGFLYSWKPQIHILLAYWFFCAVG